MHNESKCEEEKKESFAPKTTGMLFSPKKELFFPVLIVLLLVQYILMEQDTSNWGPCLSFHTRSLTIDSVKGKVVYNGHNTLKEAFT